MTSPVASLPEDLRRAVVLWVIEQLTMPEIADACRWSEVAARGRITLGLERIRRATRVHDVEPWILARDVAPAVPAALFPRLISLAGRPGWLTSSTRT